MGSKYYHQNTNNQTKCDAGAAQGDYDLDSGPPSNPGGTVDFSTTNSDWETRGTFDINVEGDAPTAGVHNTSLDVSTASAGAEYRWFLTAVSDSGCGTLASSSQTATQTGAGIKTASLSLDWPEAADRLRMTIQMRKVSGLGNQSITIRHDDAQTYIEAPWTIGGTPANVVVTVVT